MDGGSGTVSPAHDSDVLPLVFTRAEALAAGISRLEVDARVSRGEWVSLRRGVYAEAARLPASAAERHAAEVAAAVRATVLAVVGSHESAAAVHGLPVFGLRRGPPVLTRLRAPREDRPCTATPAALVAHVPDHHRTVVHGADVTTVARTAVDLARKGPPMAAVVVVDAALRRGVLPAEFDEVLLVAHGWPGSRRAGEAVAFGSPFAESPLESVGRWRMHQLGWPRPVLQAELYDVDGLMGRADFLFEDLRVVAEADGMLKYQDETALGREKLREDRFRDAGYEVFRFTWEMAVRRPVLLEQRGLRAFERARQRRRAA